MPDNWIYIAQIFEAIMLLCFGVSWPIAIFKTWRAKSVAGKSLGFLVLIFLGYLAGIASKFVRAGGSGKPLEYVTPLYALNALFVAVEIALYLKFRSRAVAAENA